MASLDQALDDLYAADPDDFVATRDRLAKELKKSGDAEAAAVVKARRKPTLVAQVLNRTARVHVDDVAAFVDAARDFARAQRASLRGDHSGVREALARTRRGLAAVSALADDVLVAFGAPSSQRSAEIRTALQAAVADPAVAAAFEEGRLEEPPALVTGFAVDDDGAAPALREPATKHAPAPAKKHAAAQAKKEKHAAAQAKKEKLEAAQAKQEKLEAAQAKQEKLEAAQAKQEKHAAVEAKKHAAAEAKKHAAAEAKKHAAAQAEKHAQATKQAAQHQQRLADARALVDELAAHKAEQRAAAIALAAVADQKAVEAEAAAHVAEAAREDADRADAAYDAAVRDVDELRSGTVTGAAR